MSARADQDDAAKELIAQAPALPLTPTQREAIADEGRRRGPAPHRPITLVGSVQLDAQRERFPTWGIPSSGMPRYFFNVHYDSHSHVDEVGEDLPDAFAAWSEATRPAGDSLKDLDGKLKPGAEWRMEVLDEAKHRLYTLIVSARKAET